MWQKKLIQGVILIHVVIYFLFIFLNFLRVLRVLRGLNFKMRIAAVFLYPLTN